MAETLINGTSIDTSILSFTSPKVFKGGKCINLLNCNTNQPLRVITPTMMTWGISEGVDPNTNLPDGKYSVTLQFPSDEYSDTNTPDANKFLEGMKRIENAVHEYMLKNSLTIYGKQYKDKDIIKDKSYPMLKYPKVRGSEERDYSKPPGLKTKVSVWDNKWNILICNQYGEKIFPTNNPMDTPIDIVKKFDKLQSIIQCAGIWLVSGNVSITWKVVQAVHYPSQYDINKNCLLPTVSHDEEEYENNTVQETVFQIPMNNDQPQTQVDSDEEIESENEDVVVEEESPLKGKKPRKKK